MKYERLRESMRKFVQPPKVVLKNSQLVIDGESFWADCEEDSDDDDLEFFERGELDKLAGDLRTRLEVFKDNNVTCHFIFKGAKKEAREPRIESIANLRLGYRLLVPLPFNKKVLCEVLDEFGIKWFVPDHDIRKNLLAVSKSFKCPILTSNLEYTLYGASCIDLESKKWDPWRDNITFDIYTPDACKRSFFVGNELMPILMALLDEDSKRFEKIPLVVSCSERTLIAVILKWIRRKSADEVMDTFLKKLDNEADKKTFIKDCEEQHMLFHGHLKPVAVEYFRNTSQMELFKSDESWFTKGLSNGRIPIAYMLLFYRKTVLGSPMFHEDSDEDAMLAAMDIVKYANGVLTNFQNTKITFVAREKGKKDYPKRTCNYDIELTYKPTLTNTGFLKETNERESSEQEVDFFNDFLTEAMPVFNVQLLEILDLPEDCWILLIALVYYCLKTRDDILAYSFLASYVTLGQASAKAGQTKSDVALNRNEAGRPKPGTSFKAAQANLAAIKIKDPKPASEIKKDLFDKIKTIDDRRVLHSFAEFQHCLEHLNYLNRLCGGKVRSTIYHKSINITIIYDVYEKIRDGVGAGVDAIKCVECWPEDSPAMELFKKLAKAYEQLMMMQN